MHALLAGAEHCREAGIPWSRHVTRLLAGQRCSTNGGLPDPMQADFAP